MFKYSIIRLPSLLLVRTENKKKRNQQIWLKSLLFHLGVPGPTKA